MRLLLGTLAVSTALSGMATAQTVRFETSVGDFDIILNPTNDPNLQPVVDNFVAYVGLGRYSYTAINRAPQDFVLQMGSFLGFPPTTDLWPSFLTRIEQFNPVVVDADGDGQVDFETQSNTIGTISLALSTGPNTGSSSFFVNLGDNSFLDSQGFVPFAQIADMTTINTIMGLNQIDLSTSLGFEPGDDTFGDIPLTDDGRLVVIERVQVIEAPEDFSFVGPIATALQLASRSELAAAAAEQSAAALAGDELLDVTAEVEAFSAVASGGDLEPNSAAAASGAPEPHAALLLGAGLAGLASRRRRRR